MIDQTFQGNSAGIYVPQGCVQMPVLHLQLHTLPKDINQKKEGREGGRKQRKKERKQKKTKKAL